MATPAQQFTLTANGTTAISSGRPDVVGRVAVQITGTWSGSITFGGHLLGTANADVSVGYTTPVSSTLATTAITANGVFYPIGDGLIVTAIMASFVSGKAVLDVIPLLG